MSVSISELRVPHILELELAGGIKPSIYGASTWPSKFDIPAMKSNQQRLSVFITHNNIFQVRSLRLIDLCVFRARDQLRLPVTLWMSDIHNVPPSTAPLSSCRLMPRVLLDSQSMSSSSSSFPAAFYFPRYYCLYQRTLPFCNVLRVGQLQLCRFCLYLSIH